MPLQHPCIIYDTATPNAMPGSPNAAHTLYPRTWPHSVSMAELSPRAMDSPVTM